MAIIAITLAVENRFVSWFPLGFAYEIVPRVITLIDRCRARISRLQRLPASITRATPFGSEISIRPRSGFYARTPPLETTCAESWKHLPLVCYTTRTSLVEQDDTPFFIPSMLSLCPQPA